MKVSGKLADVEEKRTQPPRAIRFEFFSRPSETPPPGSFFHKKIIPFKISRRAARATLLPPEFFRDNSHVLRLIMPYPPYTHADQPD